MNPDYADTSTSSNDFAVITMDRDFNYIASAHGMLIMEEPTKSAIGNFLAIGYGRLSDTGSVANAPMLAELTVESIFTGPFWRGWPLNNV